MKTSLTDEQIKLIRENAKDMNMTMLTEKTGASYYSVWNYVTKHRIQTSPIRKDARHNAGSKRKPVYHIKPGHFDFNEHTNWII